MEKIKEIIEDPELSDLEKHIRATAIIQELKRTLREKEESVFKLRFEYTLLDFEIEQQNKTIQSTEDEIKFLENAVKNKESAEQQCNSNQILEEKLQSLQNVNFLPILHNSNLYMQQEHAKVQETTAKYQKILDDTIERYEGLELTKKLRSKEKLLSDRKLYRDELMESCNTLKNIYKINKTKLDDLNKKFCINFAEIRREIEILDQKVYLNILSDYLVWLIFAKEEMQVSEEKHELVKQENQRLQQKINETILEINEQQSIMDHRSQVPPKINTASLTQPEVILEQPNPEIISQPTSTSSESEIVVYDYIDVETYEEPNDLEELPIPERNVDSEIMDNVDTTDLEIVTEAEPPVNKKELLQKKNINKINEVIQSGILKKSVKFQEDFQLPSPSKIKIPLDKLSTIKHDNVENFEADNPPSQKYFKSYNNKKIHIESVEIIDPPININKLCERNEIKLKKADAKKNPSPKNKSSNNKDSKNKQNDEIPKRITRQTKTPERLNVTEISSKSDVSSFNISEFSSFNISGLNSFEEVGPSNAHLSFSFDLGDNRSQQPEQSEAGNQNDNFFDIFGENSDNSHSFFDKVNSNDNDNLF